MRYTLIFIALIASSKFYASENEKGIKSLRSNYVIVADSVNKAIPAGTVVVTGKITPYFYDVDGKSKVDFSAAILATLDRKHSAKIDENGNYKLVLTSKDTSIFLFMEGFEEIVIWNYKFKSQHHVHIDFYPPSNTLIMTVDKPVIYLYNETNLKVDLSFSCLGDLTFTYPKYNEGWNVSVQGSTITDLNTGKNYPYLFWESKTNQLDFKLEQNKLSGFLLNTDTVVNFLENTLSQLGLNANEKTDFITYWGPKLIKDDFVFVQFLIDDDYEKFISQMSISPSPNAMRRVFMLYTAVDGEKMQDKVVPQELSSFQRQGFSLIEWGGSEVSTQILVP